MKSKNLLVVCNNFPDKEDTYVGGIFIKDQIKYLKDYFENVYVISPVAYGVGCLRKVKQEDYEFGNVRVYFPRYFNLPLFYFYARNFWIYLESRAILNLINKKEIKFDLIHAHYIWPSGLVGVELKNKFKVPVVITEHTSRTVYKELKRKNKNYIRALKLSDSIIRVNRKDVPLFIEAGVSPDKVFYIPNGYDGKKFVKIDEKRCRKKLNLPLDKKIILNVGNLYDEVKGHKYLIEAVGKIVNQRKDILCIIVGEGKLRSKLQKLINDLNLNGYVKLVGAKPHDEIPLWMNACDLLVLPSLMESFGLVQIEALACGKPVVAARNSGSEELIVNENLGYLVEPKNPDELAEKTLTALNKEWDEEHILNYVLRFRSKETAKEIFKVYEKLMN